MWQQFRFPAVGLSLPVRRVTMNNMCRECFCRRLKKSRPNPRTRLLILFLERNEWREAGVDEDTVRVAKGQRQILEPLNVFDGYIPFVGCERRFTATAIPVPTVPAAQSLGHEPLMIASKADGLSGFLKLLQARDDTGTLGAAVDIISQRDDQRGPTVAVSLDRLKCLVE